MSLSLKLGSIGLYLGGKFLLPKVATGVAKSFVSNSQVNIYLFKAIVETLERGANYVCDKVYNKEARTTGVFNVNYEHITPLSSVSFVNFERASFCRKLFFFDKSIYLYMVFGKAQGQVSKNQRPI